MKTVGKIVKRILIVLAGIIVLLAVAVGVMMFGLMRDEKITSIKYSDPTEFEKVNFFGKGFPNDRFADYFTGPSYLNPLTMPGEAPLFLANVTFEPGTRTNWHIHQAKEGGGQMLICTAGEGWYQEEGKKPVSLQAGSFVYIPAGVNHWHGAKADSWFSHISISIPGEDAANEWLTPVTDTEYSELKDKKGIESDKQIVKKYSTKREFKKANMFGTGIRNFMLAKYFTGKSYLKMLSVPGKAPLFLANVTFEPGARTFWHIHKSTSGGGQMLVCTAGEGWFQEEGKDPVSLKEGSVVYIPAGVTHWHGAKADGWFSHIAIELNGENLENVWVRAVSDEEYKKLK